MNLLRMLFYFACYYRFLATAAYPTFVFCLKKCILKSAALSDLLHNLARVGPRHGHQCYFPAVTLQYRVFNL